MGGGGAGEGPECSSFSSGSSSSEGPMLKMDEDATDSGKSAVERNAIGHDDAVASLESTLERGGKRDFELPSSFQARWGSDFESDKLVQRIRRKHRTLEERSQALDEMRERLSKVGCCFVCSYRPGDWLVETGGMSRKDYAIPTATTLLLVGPSGAGKSTLINNMICVLNKRTSGFDRAQVCDGPENGSYFLQEYMIFEKVKSICVFDSRGLSKSGTDEDLAMLKTWMQEGVCHGKAALRQSDSSVLREALEGRGRHGYSKWSMKREINFVIFVLDAVSVLGMKEISDLVRLFKSPYLSFKDDRPAVVMTHGDQLSPIERLHTRVFIGQIFGISPVDQVFDISGFTGRIVNPGDDDPVTDITLLDMLQFTLERADRNLPYRRKAFSRAVELCNVAGVTKLYNELGSDYKFTIWMILFSWLCCLGIFIAVKYGFLAGDQEDALTKSPGVYRLWFV